MKKILLLFFALVTLLSLCSCNEDGNNDEGHDGVTPVVEELVWDFNSDVYLITETKGDWRVDFVDEFSRGTGGIALIGSSDKREKEEHEIVIGNSSREVSRLAYEALYAGMTSDDDAEGYLVYTYGGSVAIAYSSEAAMKPSIAAFLECCLVPEFKACNGVVFSDFYSQRERAEENRLKEYDARLEKAKETLLKEGYENAEEIVAAIKKLYTLYETDMLIWLANLYDKEIGGFYYSSSGRDNIGYYPDLESTSQAFAMLDRSGLYDDFGGLKKAGIAPEIKETLLNWVRGLQSSEDGFFYHPQWGKQISTSRRGRDRDNACSLLRYMGEDPYYDEPGGELEGIYGAPGAVKPISRLTAPLGSKADLSAVMPVASTLPYYLQSLDAWAEYLEKLNVSRDSYSVGNSLVSDWAMIKEAGPEYVEYVIDHLNERQISETGLWEYNTPDTDYDPTDGIGFNGTNGLMKICVLYGYFGKAVPNAYNALLSTIKVGLYTNTPEKDETVCYVLNIWTCIQSMLNNVEKHDPDNYPSARALVMEKAPELIRSSYEILKPHLMSDGGFSYFEETPMNISQGALVGYAESIESDINATMVASSSTVAAMFGALKLSTMPIWYADDYYVFMDAFEALQPVVKAPKPGVETFEDYDTNGTVDIGVFGDTSYEIITHESSLNGGRALKITSQGDSSAQMLVDVRNKDKHTYNLCYFLDADFLVDDASVGEVMRFALVDDNGDPITGITLECYEENGEKYLRLLETYAGLGGDLVEIMSGITLGEWHSLRIISNKITKTVGEERKLDVYSKIILDGSYVTTVDSAVTDGDRVPDKAPSHAEIQILCIGETLIYLDNLHSERQEVPAS